MAQPITTSTATATPPGAGVAGGGELILLVTATSNQPAALVQHMSQLLQLAQTVGQDAVLGMHLVQSIQHTNKFVLIARYISSDARLRFRKSKEFIEWDENRKASGVFLTETYDFYNHIIGFHSNKLQQIK